MEANRIIAHFMGLRPKMESPDVYTYKDGVFFTVREDNPEKVMEAIVSYAKYHNDWNWLIPVIKKISTIVDLDSLEYKGLVDRLNPFIYDIDSVHNAVIEFIKWYNFKKK